MFNASWIAPKSKTNELLTTLKHTQGIQDYQKLLPQLPSKSNFDYFEKPKPKISKLFPGMPHFKLKDLFDIDNYNKQLTANLTPLKTNTIDHKLKELQYEIEILKLQNEKLYLEQIKRKRIISLDERANNSFINQDDMKLSIGSNHQSKKIKNSQYKRKNKIKEISINFIQELEEISHASSQKHQFINSDFLDGVEEKSVPKQIKGKPKSPLMQNKQLDPIQQDKHHIKPVFLAVFAALCLSKKYRAINLRKGELNQKIQEKLTQHQNGMMKFPLRQIPIHIKSYFTYVTQKVISNFKNIRFISECEQIVVKDEKFRSDIRKLYIYKLTVLLFQNLELYTRQGFLPNLIHHQININLYKEFHNNTSKFIGQRCHFLSEERIKVSKQQLLLIALEYFLFQLFIPNFFDLVNELYQEKEKKNAVHMSECQFYACVFASLTQEKFTTLFSKLKKIKNPNGNIVQRTLNVQIINNNVQKTTIQISDNINEDEKQIIEGLISSELINALEIQRPQWKEDINKYFQQIILNINSQIDG